MSLDLSRVAAQVQAMVRDLRAGSADREKQLSAALEQMDRSASELDALKEKIEVSKTSWLVAGIEKGLNSRYTPLALPESFQVLATDGSHIEVDRHRSARCYLFNISRIALRYGPLPDALLESVPTLYARPDELVIMPPDGSGRGQAVEGTLLGARRTVEECRHLAELAEKSEAGVPTLALLDGTLMLWGLEPYPDFVTDLLLERGLLVEFDRIRRASAARNTGSGLAFASYISAPRSSDVSNALRIAACPYEEPNCDMFCRSGKGECARLGDVNDAQLFSRLLAPGERSAPFASRSKIVRERYRDNAVWFFYIRIDEEEIARVEMPAWVAQDEALLRLTHVLVLEQCRRGDGYPVALSEAHEQAVVTLADREAFWQLVDAELMDEKIAPASTGKSRSKRTRWV